MRLAWVLGPMALLNQCGGEVPLTAPTGATLSISANPTAIPSAGGLSTITVTGFKASDDGGGTLPDGTQIFFTTTIGVIEERVDMENGIARAYLRSNGRSGQAMVRASSGGGIDVAETTVDIGTGGEGVVVNLTANPATLGPGEFTSEIVATVTDGDNNFLSDVPIIFSTDAGALASGGAILRTNPQGQAFDRLTLTPEDLPSGATAATVEARSGAVVNSVMVSRTALDPIVESAIPSFGAPGASLTVTVTGQNFQPGATVNFGDGISITGVTFVSSSTLRVAIVIPASATEGARTVQVTNPDGRSGGASIFTVTTGACDFDLAPLDLTDPGSGTAADPFLIDATLCPGPTCDVTFNASLTVGTIVSYRWDFGDGSPTVTVAGPVTMHTYTLGVGTLVLPVLLTTTDNVGATCTVSKWIELP